MILVHITANVDDAAVDAYFNAANALDYPYYEYEYLVAGLLAEGALQELTSLYAFYYDEPYIFFGMAEDEDGNFTEMWASKEITFTKEGCSPAEEFFAGETRISRSEAVAQRLGKLSYE